MGRVWRLLRVQAVVLAEYLFAAAGLVAVVYLLASTPPKPTCVDSCFGQGLSLALFAAACLAVLVVGLPVSLVIASVRQYRRYRRTPPGRPKDPGNVVAAATLATVLGIVVAGPLSCMLAATAFRLLH